MSAMETMIWYILGYITMPLIFIGGFAVTVLVTCVFLELIGKGLDPNELESKGLNS